MPSIRSYTAAAVLLAVLLFVYSMLTQTNIILGILGAALLVGIGLLLDWLPMSLRSPREYRVTILLVPIVLVLGIYTILTPTNVLLWVIVAGVLLGIGVLLDWLLSDDVGENAEN